jgi:hypothetical protein
LVMMENDVPREDDSENDADDVSKNVFFFLWWFPSDPNTIWEWAE